MKKLLHTLFAISLMQFAVSSAHALMITSTVDGLVTVDNGGTNPFGLNVGDGISLDVTYDDAFIIGNNTDEQHFLGSFADWDFTMTLGSFSFGQADVTDPSYTSFFFNQGDFDGIRFYLDPIDIGNYNNLIVEDFDGGRALFAEGDSAVYLEAAWDFSKANGDQSSPVPEPSVLLLMLTGLLGLTLMKKKA